MHRFFKGINLFLLGTVIVGVFSLFNFKVFSFVPPADHFENRGYSALADYDRLPYLDLGAFQRHAGSFDRNSGNADGSAYFQRYNADTSGYVVLEEFNPGTINRIWLTAPNGGNIRFYFDGETAPRIDVSVTDFISGQVAPFVSPFVENNTISSGGYFSYYPISFEESVRVEFTNVPTYYNFDYKIYQTSDGITTYTGNEDLTIATAAWNNVANDPKDTSNNQTFTLSRFSLTPTGTQTLANITGMGSIRQVNLRLPQLQTTQYPPQTYTDNGRAFTGYSEFDMSISEVHDNIYLLRRMDYFIANQKANVYIDGVLAGEWFTPGSNSNTRWRITQFKIPSSLTLGKSSIQVKIEFVSSQFDWNEFYYWAKSSVNGDLTTTDTLDIGNVESENAHNYVIFGSAWSGEYTGSGPFDVPTNPFDPESIDILSNARIKIYWDGESSPSVDIPIGFFFGQAGDREGFVKGLFMNNDPLTHTFHNYFPMPYGSSARIELVNESGVELENVSGSIVYSDTPYEGLGVSAGYFSAFEHSETPTTAGQDYVMLNLPTGAGRVVGVQQNIVSNDTWILEGDERIFIDHLDENPVIHGTGTEDFYNGGWYFNQGIFSLQTHGAPIISTYAGDTHYSMYRWFLSDSIPFEKGIRLGIEHGSAPEVNKDYHTAVFAYVIPDYNSLILSDTLDVGDTASELAHNYSIGTQVWTGNQTLNYYGRTDGANYSGIGRAHTGFSQFEMTIPSDNDGIRLTRVYNADVRNQKSNVFIDNVLAGVWYDGGHVQGAGLSIFEIPPVLTAGKSNISVRIEFVSSTIDWNEFEFRTYSHHYDISDTVSPSATGFPSTSTPTNSTTQTWNWTSASDSHSGVSHYLWRTTGTAILSGSIETNQIVTNLSDGNYTFYVKAVDEAGNEGTERSGTVVVDTTSPIISDISSVTTSTGATITWVTNENSSSRVDYSVDSTYNLTTGVLNTSPRVINHTVGLTDLIPCTIYNYRVLSTDQVSNETIDSENIFLTSGCTTPTPDPNPPSTIKPALKPLINPFFNPSLTVKPNKETNPITPLVPIVEPIPTEENTPESVKNNKSQSDNLMLKIFGLVGTLSLLFVIWKIIKSKSS